MRDPADSYSRKKNRCGFEFSNDRIKKPKAIYAFVQDRGDVVEKIVLKKLATENWRSL